VARRQHLRALSAAALAVAAAVALAGCTALVPARDPRPGELSGTWAKGGTVLTIHDQSFTVADLPADRVSGYAGSDTRIDVRGELRQNDKGRIDGLREIDLFYTAGGGQAAGVIQAAFDPTTRPVSIAIVGGSADEPTLYRLAKR
jgi:hypothetical protein